MVDQAVVSGVNFLTIVVLARAVTPSDFGYFVLAFTVLQSVGTLQAALVTRPHNVLAAVLRGRHYVDYSTTAVLAQIAFTGALVLLGATAAGVAYAAGSSRALLVLAVVPALAAWQLQELGRRMLYTEGRLRDAVAHDVLAYGSYACALVIFHRHDLLTGPRALLLLAAAFAIDALVLGVHLRSTLSGRLEPKALREAWHFGKWLGAAEVGQWFSTHFYIYLGGAIIGPLASGALKAGQTLLGPISVFLTFVTSYLPIVYARELESSGGTGGKTRKALVAIVPVVVPYCLLVGFFAEPLLVSVYGDEYGRYADVVRLFALYYAVLTLSTVAIALLSAMGKTRDVFRGQAMGALLSLAIGWWLLLEFGPAGGVAGILLSWVVAMLLFVRGLRTALDHAERPGPSGRSVAHDNL